MPGWMYRKTKQPNLSTGTYLADKGCTKRKKKHTVFQRPFNLNLQFISHSSNEPTCNSELVNLKTHRQGYLVLGHHYCRKKREEGKRKIVALTTKELQ